MVELSVVYLRFVSIRSRGGINHQLTRGIRKLPLSEIQFHKWDGLSVTRKAKALESDLLPAFHEGP